MFTPWGASDHQQKLADGIVFYGTPSHGGIKVSPERLADMPEALRSLGEGAGGAFFEEDVAYAAVFLAFPDEFTPDEVAQAHETVKSWFPDEYEAWSGVTLTAEDSFKVAEREFHAAHAGDFITVAAWGSTPDNDVPEGFVGVAAAIGGRENPDGERACFFVPVAEYHARTGSFVVDLARHPRSPVEFGASKEIHA